MDNSLKIGVIGLGLIGGSLARTIVNKTNHVVYAYDRDESALKLGSLLRAYHHVLTKDDVSSLDMLIVALYPKATIEVVKGYLPLLKDGCIVADVCGNKRGIVKAFKEFSLSYPKLSFISTHPMAGREFSGIKHSSINLFDRASMIIIPVNTDLKVIKFFKDFSLSLGFGSTVVTTASEHDKIIAYTSQLAHVVSSAYVKSPTAENYLGFSAGSFRDMTRVARLSPEMWTELFLDNSDYLVLELQTIIDNLTDYLNALKDKDKSKLYEMLQDGTSRKINFDKLKNKKLS